MEPRKRRRHLNPRIKHAVESLGGAVMGIALAAFFVQALGIALGLIAP